MKIIVTGGSGYIGKALIYKLSENLNYETASLSRNPGDRKAFFWDPANEEIDIKAVEFADHIIHLAGENIGQKRWTEQQKKSIIESRTKSTRLLFDSFKKIGKAPKSIVSASATGYYGAITSDKIFEESDKHHNDFLGTTCKAWEDEVDRFEQLGTRVVKIRTGLVIGKNSKAIKKMMLPINMGLGSPLGTGKQYMPWIQIDDLFSIYIKALTDENMIGAYNAVAPEHLTNKEFMQIIAKKAGRPFFMPAIPEFVLNILLGEMASIITKGSRVSASKVKLAGFDFEHTNLDGVKI